MLLGFVDARIAALEARREFTERQEYDRMSAALRGTLGPRLDNVMALGAEWTEDGRRGSCGGRLCLGGSIGLNIQRDVHAVPDDQRAVGHPHCVRSIVTLAP